MKIKISKATPLQLDWLVAKCEGEMPKLVLGHYITVERKCYGPPPAYAPSTDWMEGGPIIERERICLKIGHDGLWLAYSMQNYDDRKDFMQCDSTPLIAAMRCFVQFKLGDEVEIPEELV